MKDIRDYIESLTTKVIEGELNPLDVYCELSDMQKAIKSALDMIESHALTEAQKYAKDECKVKGYKVSVTERKVWDFKHIPEWREAEQRRKDIEERSKIAATHGLDVNLNTGEITEKATYKTITYLKLTK
jgi:hypothetical protein